MLVQYLCYLIRDIKDRKQFSLAKIELRWLWTGSGVSSGGCWCCSSRGRVQGGTGLPKAGLCRRTGRQAGLGRCWARAGTGCSAALPWFWFGGASKSRAAPHGGPKTGGTGPQPVARSSPSVAPQGTVCWPLGVCGLPNCCLPRELCCARAFRPLLCEHPSLRTGEHS